MPLPVRDYVIEEYTRTVCPSCFAEKARRSDDPEAFVDGLLVSREGSIWMRRFCPVHGETESLYEEDAEVWRARSGWSTPTSTITPDRKGNWKGFPEGYRDGLPASHGQHTCILLLNLTEHCNYSCPTCYATALAPGSKLETERPTWPEIEKTVETAIAREQGRLGVLMLSGGEPTVRRDLESIIERLAEKPITRILINTNGRRIARDDRFLRFLSEHKDRVEVYLQFDGLRPCTHTALRGEDLSEEKPLALKRLDSAGVLTTLVTTVKRGVNEDEVGEVLLLGLETPRCTGMAIQPAFGSGRGSGIEAQSRATPTGVLRRLGEQTQGLVDWQDFIPLPCSHKDCCDITYLLRTRRNEWKSLPKLIGREELKKWLHLVSNTISFESASEVVKKLVGSGALQRVFSESQKTRTLNLVGDIFSMCQCIPGLPELLQVARGNADPMQTMLEKTFRVTVKMFMDSHTFHEARIRQCCVHTGTFEDDPRRLSFCWRWLFADASDFPDRKLESLPMVRS